MGPILAATERACALDSRWPQGLWLRLTTMPSVLEKPAAHAARLEADAGALHEALTELVRVYQFRDRDRICCHDISVTQCYALDALLRRGPSGLNELAAE